MHENTCSNVVRLFPKKISLFSFKWFVKRLLLAIADHGVVLSPYMAHIARSKLGMASILRHVVKMAVQCLSGLVQCIMFGYRPIARDVIIKITGNIRKSGSHVGVPLIGASTFYMAISANNYH